MKKILIIKIGAIGDVVMCLPLISEIKKTHPESEITWLCGNQVRPLLERIDGIDKLISVDENRLLKGSFISRISEILKVWAQLAFQKFNLALYYYHSNLYKLLYLPAITKKTQGFGKQKNTGSSLPVPGRHHSLEYIQAFSGIKAGENFQPEYPFFRDLPKKDQIESTTKRVVFACGGAKNILRNDDLRRWPISHYKRLGKLVLDQGWELILTGAPSDSWVRDEFSGLAFTDLIGTLKLCGFVDFLASADVLVTHDSGPLHLADLAECPVLGLFGPTMPEEKKSLNKKSRYIWGGAHLACRPCYDGKEYAACENNLCLKSVDPETVFAELQNILK